MNRGKNDNTLGDTIYQAREGKQISTTELATRVGVHKSAMARIQLGEIKQPRPALLARIAEELDLNVGELYALAGYQTVDQLPDLKGWINIKHRSLPPEAAEELEGHLNYLVDKYDTKRNASTDTNT